MNGVLLAVAFGALGAFMAVFPSAFADGNRRYMQDVLRIGRNSDFTRIDRWMTWLFRILGVLIVVGVVAGAAARMAR